MDELMAVHHAKIQRRSEIMAPSDDDSEDECTISTQEVYKMSAVDGPSQECVGDRSKRSNILWASVRRAHSIKPTSKYTYAQAVKGDVSNKLNAPEPTNE